MLPVIDYILVLLGSANYVSKLDLKSEYWRVKLNNNNKENTAFTMLQFFLHFTLMSLGLANAPGVFKELMSIVRQGQKDLALRYLDDVLICSDTMVSKVYISITSV